MREEVKNLFEQADRDLVSAKNCFLSKDYYVSAFLCQQAVEKALKGFFIIKKSKSAGPTHSLIFLASESGLPKSFYGFLGSLTPEFITTRYPDVAGDAPYKLYDAEKVKDYLTKTLGVLGWIKRHIKK